MPGLPNPKVVFVSKFLRQDDGTESRGGIADFVIEEAFADSKDLVADREAKKLAAQRLWQMNSAEKSITGKMTYKS